MNWFPAEIRFAVSHALGPKVEVVMNTPLLAPFACRLPEKLRMDSAHQVIVAARATNQTSDKQQAAAMMEETIDNVGAVPREVSADAG